LFHSILFFCFDRLIFFPAIPVILVTRYLEGVAADFHSLNANYSDNLFIRLHILV